MSKVKFLENRVKKFSENVVDELAKFKNPVFKYIISYFMYALITIIELPFDLFNFFLHMKIPKDSKVKK